MQISHESPLCLLNESRNYNDYDYALVHLFEKYDQYYNFFKESLKLKRRVILDNSIFELGESFNTSKYAHWIKKLKPTDYIIPDAFNSLKDSIKMFDEWITKYKTLPGKKIAVVHGGSFEEIIKCYKYYDKFNVKIAFNFADNVYKNIGSSYTDNKDVAISIGRTKVINKLFKQGIININKKHHLLGASIPQEFKSYTYDWIESCDTSNPIVHAIKNIKYSAEGLFYKESIRLVDLIETPLKNINLEILDHNIKIFRNFCRG